MLSVKNLIFLMSLPCRIFAMSYLCLNNESSDDYCFIDDNTI